jgi:dihydrofolate reductase
MSRYALVPAGSSVRITAEPLNDLLNRLEKQVVRRVWLVGGSALVGAFKQAGRIDEYIISVIPQLLGDGLSLFAPGRQVKRLSLLGSQAYGSGVVQLYYRTETI